MRIIPYRAICNQAIPSSNYLQLAALTNNKCFFVWSF